MTLLLNYSRLYVGLFQLIKSENVSLSFTGYKRKNIIPELFVYNLVCVEVLCI